MKINTKNLSFVNFNNQLMQWVKFNGKLVYEAWKKLMVSGVLPLTLVKSAGKDLIDYKIYGNSVQNGTPILDAPVEIESVGEYDETTGKYKIPVRVSNENEEIITNVYLDAPLRKLGDYADYVDFENKKVVRKIYKHTITNNDSWSFYNNTTIYNLYRQNIRIVEQNAMIVGTRVPGLCNVLTSNESGWNYWKDETVHFGQANSGVYFITKNQYSTATEIYNYLSNNGKNEVYILYPLRKPIEETIELPNIPTVKGTAIVEVDTTTQPSNASVIYVSGTSSTPDTDNELTEEQIEAINNMSVSNNDDGLSITYDEEVLDVDFNIEEENLIVDNAIEEVDFNINENGEMEVEY